MFSSILMNCLTYIPGFYMKFTILQIIQIRHVFNKNIKKYLPKTIDTY
jgi:hypothetical protein